MFATAEYLKKRTGKDPVDREKFLKLLVSEYSESKSVDCKHQILANLANFAYDPINYKFLRELKVIDLFLNELSEGDETSVELAIGGLCNLCLDRDNKDYINANGGVNLIAHFLGSSNIETVVGAITTLLYLVTPQSKPELTRLDIIKCMVELSRDSSPRVKNLAEIFLADICTEKQVREVKGLSEPVKDCSSRELRLNSGECSEKLSSCPR